MGIVCVELFDHLKFFVSRVPLFWLHCLDSTSKLSLASPVGLCVLVCKVASGKGRAVFVGCDNMERRLTGYLPTVPYRASTRMNHRDECGIKGAVILSATAP